MSKLNVRTITNESLPRLNPLLLPLPWIAVILLILIFLAIKYSGNMITTDTEKQPVKEFPQIFMTDVDSREFDDKGELHFQLKTPLVRHFQNGEKAGPTDFTLLDSPQLTFIDSQDKPAWHITAQEGRSDANNDNFTLKKNVVAQQISTSQGEILINTEELRINTRDQFAQTDKAVTMRAAKGQMETVGIHVDIKNDQIELLSHVKGTYEP